MRKPRINLIPPELRPKIELPAELIPIGIFGVFLLYATTSAASLSLSIRAKRIELAQVESESQMLHDKIESLTSLKKNQDIESEKFKSLQEVLNRKNYWSQIFKELSLLIPDGVWLSVMGGKGEVQAKQLVLKGEATSQKKVAEFFSALEKSQHFSGVSMNFSERDPKMAPRLYKFEFIAPFPHPASGGDS